MNTKLILGIAAVLIQAAAFIFMAYFDKKGMRTVCIALFIPLVMGAVLFGHAIKPEPRTPEVVELEIETLVEELKSMDAMESLKDDDPVVVVKEDGSVQYFSRDFYETRKIRVLDDKVQVVHRGEITTYSYDPKIPDDGKVNYFVHEDDGQTLYIRYNKVTVEAL